LGLNYIGAGKSINWLFILFILSILQWILVGLEIYKCRNKLFSDIPNFRIKEKVPFIKDEFYVFWNIFPIILYAFFSYLDMSWNTLFKSILLLDKEHQILKFYNELFGNYAITHYDILSIIVMFLLGLCAVFVQIDKQINFTKKCNKIYWWDIKINKLIYWYRSIFLFFNMILIGYISFILFKITVFISLVLNVDLNVFPFHPDHYGGLKVIMEISSIIVALYLLRSLMGIVGLYDHKEQGFSQKIGDYYNLAYLFAGVILIIYQIIMFKKHLLKAFEKYNFENIIFNKDKYLEFINSFTNNLHKEVISINDIEKIEKYYTYIDFNKFSLDINLYTSSVFTFILPLSLWFIFRYFTNSDIKRDLVFKCKYSCVLSKIQQNFKIYFDFVIKLIIMFITVIAVIFLNNVYFNINIYYLKIYIGHIFYVILLSFPFFLLYKKSYYKKTINIIWIVLTTAVLVSLPYLLFLTNEIKIDIDKVDNILLGLIVFQIFNLYLFNKKQKEKLSFYEKDIKIILLVAIMLILFLQISTFIMNDIYHIDNEHRSAFLYQCVYGKKLELHHINYGLIGIIFLPSLIKVFSIYAKKYSIILTIVLGIFYGMVWDEWLYYMYKHVTDAAYRSLATIISSFIGMYFTYLIWILFLQKWKQSNDA